MCLSLLVRVTAICQQHLIAHKTFFIPQNAKNTRLQNVPVAESPRVVQHSSVVAADTLSHAVTLHISYFQFLRFFSHVLPVKSFCVLQQVISSPFLNLPLWLKGAALSAGIKAYWLVRWLETALPASFCTFIRVVE